ncbi:hypothetical protein [Mycobacterium basiliense]|uniref:hypothetical protein n=1 Tax=Mycobacterium basiliense TaxID=2094119 RepID=UPI001E295CC7|nr:hypothetical protein [Mycobacterium basiliense]
MKLTILIETAQSVVSRAISEALESATPASVLSAFVEDRGTTPSGGFRPSVVTLKTVDGREIRVSTLTGTSSSAAELVSADATADAAPSGTFVLTCGKTLEIEKGRLVGGTAASGQIPDWAVFYLLPADRERSQ